MYTISEIAEKLKAEYGLKYSCRHIRRLISDGKMEAERRGPRRLLVAQAAYFLFVKNYVIADHAEGGGHGRE